MFYHITTVIVATLLTALGSALSIKAIEYTLALAGL